MYTEKGQPDHLGAKGLRVVVRLGVGIIGRPKVRHNLQIMQLCFLSMLLRAIKNR